MEDEQNDRGCKYEDQTYSHGSEFCIDTNCFRCVDGELKAYSGAFPG
jgi:hypothetical protein